MKQLTQSRFSSIHFVVRPTQLVFLIIFAAINCFLYFASETVTTDGVSYDATFQNASDGHRYWGSAINLAEKYSFSIPRYLYREGVFEEDPPLARATPLPAIIFAIPIKIFGFQSSSGPIVFIQTALLLVMGLLTRRIGEPFGANKDLIQGLVIFNPNLIGLAHHAQSDFLFAFGFSIILVIITRTLSFPSNIKFVDFLTLGLVCGLLALTRPIGYYYAMFCPLLLFAILFSSSKVYQINIKKVLLFAILSMIVAQSVTTPWALRNYRTFGDFSITQNEKSIMLDAQYNLFFIYNNVLDKGERILIANSKAERLLLLVDQCNDSSEIDSQPLAAETRGQLCKMLYSVGLLGALFSEPPFQLLRALSIGWSSLFLAGGSGRLQNYLGLDSDNSGYVFDNFKNFQSFVTFVSEKSKATFLVFVPTTAFSIFTRLAGFIGLIVLIRNRRYLPALVFHVSTLVFLTTLCMFYSMVRYRAPMEPILMLLGTVGISTTIQLLKEKVATYNRYKD